MNLLESLSSRAFILLASLTISGDSRAKDLWIFTRSSDEPQESAILRSRTLRLLVLQWAPVERISRYRLDVSASHASTPGFRGGRGLHDGRFHPPFEVLQNWNTSKWRVPVPARSLSLVPLMYLEIKL